METVTIPEVFGANPTPINDLCCVECLDGLNAIFDRMKSLSLALKNTQDPDAKYAIYLAIDEAILDGEKLSSKIEKINRESIA